jgi:hypothetical protein
MTVAISHFKTRSWAQDQGGASFQSAGMLMNNAEDLKIDANEEVGA